VTKFTSNAIPSAPRRSIATGWSSSHGFTGIDTWWKRHYTGESLLTDLAVRRKISASTWQVERLQATDSNATPTLRLAGFSRPTRPNQAEPRSGSGLH